MFALTLAKVPFFQHEHHHAHSSLMGQAVEPGSLRPNQDEEEEDEEPITLETLLTGPHIIPRHPTLLSAIAGAGAGLVQGLAFTPVENLVR